MPNALAPGRVHLARRGNTRLCGVPSTLDAALVCEGVPSDKLTQVLPRLPCSADTRNPKLRSRAARNWDHSISLIDAHAPSVHQRLPAESNELSVTLALPGRLQSEAAFPTLAH